MELIPLSKAHKLQKTPVILVVVGTFAMILLTFIPICYPLLGYPLYLLQNFSNSPPSSSHGYKDAKKCDIFSGDWVPNPEAPYYTNTTCWAIHEHQNCMKYGRPDTEFMKWRWKPDGCELPVFDPAQFLEIVRGKSMAFVGDSVGRNHMQSLICLLSRVSLHYLLSIYVLYVEILCAFVKEEEGLTVYMHENFIIRNSQNYFVFISGCFSGLFERTMNCRLS